MNSSSPRPSDTTHITCPACGHGVDAHNVAGCTQRVSSTDDDPRTMPWCRCQWSPNDIAHQLLYGQLTPVPLHTGASLEPTPTCYRWPEAWPHAVAVPAEIASTPDRASVTCRACLEELRELDKHPRCSGCRGQLRYDHGLYSCDTTGCSGNLVRHV